MVITKRVTSRRSRSQKSVRRVTKIASTGSAGGVEVHPSKTVVVVVMVISIRRRRRREGRKACERAWRKNGLEKNRAKNKPGDNQNGTFFNYWDGDLIWFSVGNNLIMRCRDSETEKKCYAILSRDETRQKKITVDSGRKSCSTHHQKNLDFGWTTSHSQFNGLDDSCSEVENSLNSLERGEC